MSIRGRESYPPSAVLDINRIRPDLDLQFSVYQIRLEVLIFSRTLADRDLTLQNMESQFTTSG
jgi:hypothetical protein